MEPFLGPPPATPLLFENSFPVLGLGLWAGPAAEVAGVSVYNVLKLRVGSSLFLQCWSLGINTYLCLGSGAVISVSVPFLRQLRQIPHSMTYEDDDDDDYYYFSSTYYCLEELFHTSAASFWILMRLFSVGTA